MPINNDWHFSLTDFFRGQALKERTKGVNMSANQHSRRFSPNKLTEKIVPALLVVLVIVLLAVFIIIGLSSVGLIPLT